MHTRILALIQRAHSGIHGYLHGAGYLEQVWHSEGGNGNCPDLTRLANETRNNVRDCLMRLEVELMSA